MKKDNETIHVIYATDDNYTELTCVSMASMSHNTKRNIHFHVIESRLSSETKEVIFSLKSQFPNVECSFHNFKIPSYINLPVEGHLSFETYLRVFISDIFLELDKVIYIDGDTVIVGDIEELWNVDLEDKIVGAVANNHNGAAFNCIEDILGIEKPDIYFQAGVLLIDVKKFGMLTLPKKIAAKSAILFRLFKRCNVRWCADQEILNYFLKGKVKILPHKFNFQPSTYNLYNHFMHWDTLKDAGAAFANPIIIHYIWKPKPSKITKNPFQLLFWEQYYKYKAMTPYADVENDEARIAKYHLMEENSFIENVPAFFARKWYPLFVETADKLPGILNRRKLALWGAGIHTSCMMAVFASRGVYADIIVDGTSELQGTELFNYVVRKPNVLNTNSDKYYVLLSMEQEAPAKAVSEILKIYGYNEEQFSHVYKPLWDMVNNLL